jgi:UDP-sulfoquinovose synthase
VKHAGGEVGIDVTIDHVQNPRFELEKHYYNPVHTKLPSLGLEPTLLSENLIESTLGVIQRYRDRVISDVIAPRTQWRPAPAVGQPAS